MCMRFNSFATTGRTNMKVGVIDYHSGKSVIRGSRRYDHGTIEDNYLNFLFFEGGKSFFLLVPSYQLENILPFCCWSTSTVLIY